MEPILLDGTAAAKEIYESLKIRSKTLFEQHGVVPVLATIIVGDDHASKIYIRMKGRACKRAGIASKVVELPASSKTEDVTAAIRELNDDPELCGILLQHPVPRHIDEQACFNIIAAEKDADGVNNLSFARTAMGLRAFKCATPHGIIKLLKRNNIPMEGKHAVIVGRSAILGKPLSMLLLNENATVTVCHSKTTDIKTITRQADILCVGIGRPQYVDSSWIREGAVVVDAGYNEGNVGDTDINELKNKTSAYTPVPGGVGPMTVATLIEQTVEAAELRVE